MVNFIIVAVGGAIGALLRYALECAIKGNGWLAGIGTFVVNAVGCFAIGLFCGWITHIVFSSDIKNAASLFLITGICGGFTTFSSFALDSVRYFENGDTLIGIAYILLTLFVGIALCMAGLWLGTRI